MASKVEVGESKDGSTSPSSSLGLVGDMSPPVESVAVESSTSVLESVSGAGGGNVVKKAVWSKPSGVGVVEVVSPVMGAVSWPALGESAKVGAKLQADGSKLPALQVTGNSSTLSHTTASVDPTPTSSSNHVTNSVIKQNGGTSNKGVSELENQELKVESLYEKPAYPRRGPSSGNEHYYQRNSYRRGNGGPHPRGGGSYHHSYGDKVDQGQGRGRNFNIHSQRVGFRRGGYIRPPVHNSGPFIPLRPFGNSVLYPDVASGMIYFQGPPPFYFPVPDPLHDKIMNQINYYFSNDNLVRDTYLRRHMDEQGWVPVSLIARFNKVSSLTDNVQLILDVMQKSTVVEVQGDKMRRRNDWMKWLMPPAVECSLESQLQGVRLEEGFSSRSSSVELFSQLQQGGSDRAQMA